MPERNPDHTFKFDDKRIDRLNLPAAGQDASTSSSLSAL